MVKRKRRIAIKAGAILLAVMLFMTFFSGTINNFLTPKVTLSVARWSMLLIEEEYVYGAVIPLGAVINGSSVYVVTQSETFLGSELTIELRHISISAISAGQVVVSEGLDENERIATSWDRPLKDGQRVLLPNG